MLIYIGINYKGRALKAMVEDFCASLQKQKDLLFVNLGEIIKLASTFLMGLFGIGGFFLSCYEGAGKYNFLSMVGLLFILALFSFVASFVKICYLNNSNTVYKHSSTTINVCYGDLFEIAFNDKAKKVVVVPVNTAFDTIVDKSLVKYPKNLVSPNTIHGRFIDRLIGAGLKIEEIDRRIESFFITKGIYPTVELSSECRPRGKRKIYEPGTVSVIEFKDTNFFLLGLSVFDDNNNAQCTKDQFVYALQKFIIFCDKHSQGRTIYLPLMGTNLSRTDMSHQESLQSLVALFKMYANRLHNKINIIIYTGDKDKVSIYDAK